MAQAAQADLTALEKRWHNQLRDQQRLSPHTLSAYRRDIAQFIIFLGEHFGRDVSADDFASLNLTDLRSFMAARRADGTAGRSLNRSLSALRHFAGFLTENGIKASTAFSTINPPASKAGLPRPVASQEVLRLIDLALSSTASNPSKAWTGKRDAALIDADLRYRVAHFRSAFHHRRAFG